MRIYRRRVAFSEFLRNERLTLAYRTLIDPRCSAPPSVQSPMLWDSMTCCMSIIFSGVAILLRRLTFVLTYARRSPRTLVGTSIRRAPVRCPLLADFVVEVGEERRVVLA
jgi:hypothetical protein